MDARCSHANQLHVISLKHYTTHACTNASTPTNSKDITHHTNLVSSTCKYKNIQHNIN